MNLDEFLEQEESASSKRKKCITCTMLSEEALDQVHGGRAREPKPVPFPVISRWLEREHGIKIQASTIRAHFVAGHHND